MSQAITVSCNYFFYEVGRLTGIKTLASYAKQFGLGEYTGIEIGGPGSAEAKGSMATPEFAEAEHLEWTDGQTLTAAIGQSYDLFTPLQLANYIATLVGDGQHYEAHLLKNVKSYDNSSVIYAYDKEPLNTVQMSDSTIRRRQNRYCRDGYQQHQQRCVCVLRPLRRSSDRCGRGH